MNPEISRSTILGTCPSSARAPQAHVSQIPSNRRILVVDDDPTIGSALVRILSHAGHVGEHAGNGLIAWERLSADLGHFDLVITDHEMPELSGLDLTQLLVEAGYAGRVLVHCSPLSPVAAEAFRRFGVRDILEKPCAIETLLKTVGAQA